MKYAYLFGASLFLVPWLALFIHRRDLRKEIVSSSILVGLGGLLFEKIWYTIDWVQPITVFGTTVGIEDFVLGFCSGGIGSVIFKEIFHKDDYKSIKYYHHWVLILPILFGFIVADVLFRFIGFFSYSANLIGFGFIILTIFIIRRDLIKEGLLGGGLLVLVSIPIYWIIFFVFPGWRESYWNIANISNINFLGIPYEDIIWWFFTGANLSIIYDYYYGLRIRKLPEQDFKTSKQTSQT